MKRIGVYLFFGLLFIHFFMVFVCCWFFTFVFSSGTLFSIELPFESWCIHIDNVFKDEFSSVHRDVGGAAIKNPTANAGDTGDMGSIPGSGRFPGKGNGSPLQYSCLENPMDREAWWANSPWGHKESDTTEWFHFLNHLTQEKDWLLFWKL